MMKSATTAGPPPAAEAFLSCRTLSSVGGGYGVFDLDDALRAPWSLVRQTAESDSLVADMPTVHFDDDGGDGEEIICSVCREGAAGSAAGIWKRVPCCGHVYHADCISAWLHHRDSCPLCRFDILRLH